jgi:ribokinase
MSNDTPAIAILGVFVADTAYRAERPPRMGETIIGNSFTLGPGGKGSNQAVAVGRLGAKATMITKLGDDAFADMAIRTWEAAGVTPAVTRDPASYTGAAYIFIEEATGDNAIIVCPGAAMTLTPADIDKRADVITAADVFITQLEQPINAATRALQIAGQAGVTTILNPAPAAPLEDAVYPLCGFVTPNETEAEALTGLPVGNVIEARAAAEILLRKGAGAVIITMGEAGAYYHDAERSQMVGALSAGPVVETTGAGDAFNGGFAVALARGADPIAAVRFGCAVAAISVTRPGTAPSMPSLSEVEALLAR